MNKPYENNKSSETTKHLSKSGITKPTIELDDFYAYLDSKVVEKIKQTSNVERERIANNIQQYEYDINGAKNILNYLNK